MTCVGNEDTRLVVLRGPSGSGKSSTARRLRGHLGRSVALIEQDYFRRIVLKERDVSGGANVELISTTARFALDRGWNVIVEGIMHAERYADMLRELRDDHLGETVFYYFDVTLAETLRRHETRPQAAEFGIDEMRKATRTPTSSGAEGSVAFRKRLDVRMRDEIDATCGGAPSRKPASSW